MTLLSTTRRVTNPEADARVKAVFDDIRATRGRDDVNNLWHYLAFDPALLEEVWRDVKAVMAAPTLLDPKTKEMIYLAVSIANACSYCVHSQLARAFRTRRRNGLDRRCANLLHLVRRRSSRALTCRLARCRSRRGRTRHAESPLYLDLLIDQRAKLVIVETFDLEGEAFPCGRRGGRARAATRHFRVDQDEILADACAFGDVRLTARHILLQLQASGCRNRPAVRRLDRRRSGLMRQKQARRHARDGEKHTPSRHGVSHRPSCADDVHKADQPS
jgi:AhpD family alkylhydroperoxidase